MAGIRAACLWGCGSANGGNCLPLELAGCGSAESRFGNGANGWGCGSANGGRAARGIRFRRTIPHVCLTCAGNAFIIRISTCVRAAFLQAYQLDGKVEKPNLKGGGIYDGIRNVYIINSCGFVFTGLACIYRNETCKKIISPPCKGKLIIFSL